LTNPEADMPAANHLETNKALARRYLRAIAEMRLDEARGLMHEKCVCELPTITLNPNVFDRDAMLQFIGSVQRILPAGIRFEFKDMTAEDNRVSVIADGHAKTIEGTDYNNHYHFLLEIEAGKIARHLEYFDSFLGAKVMGPLLKRQLAK
jgi:ketosteroid isomerase-like protein